MAQGAKNWGCTVASKSKKGNFHRTFLFHSTKKTGGARAPCGPPVPPPLQYTNILSKVIRVTPSLKQDFTKGMVPS